MPGAMIGGMMRNVPWQTISKHMLLLATPSHCHSLQPPLGIPPQHSKVASASKESNCCVTLHLLKSICCVNLHNRQQQPRWPTTHMSCPSISQSQWGSRAWFSLGAVPTGCRQGWPTGWAKRTTCHVHPPLMKDHAYHCGGMLKTQQDVFWWGESTQ